MVDSIQRRKLNYVFENLSPTQASIILGEYGIDEDTKLDQRLDLIISHFDTSKTSDTKKFWQLIETCKFHSDWIDAYTVEHSIKTLKELKEKLISETFPASKLSIMQLYKKPKVYAIILFSEKKRSTLDKALIPDISREVAYYLPEQKAIFMKMYNDEEGKSFQEHLVSVFGEFTSFRTKTMIISKFYNDNTMINDLHIMSDHQVAGFSGMDYIAFHGDHIKQGLYGLHKRQDIRVHLDQIGPRIEVSGPNLHLKIGPKVWIKTYDGISEISALIEEFH